MAKGAGGTVRPVRIGGRTVGYQVGRHGYTTRREANAAVRSNVARRIPGGEHMRPRELSAAVRQAMSGARGGGRTGPTRGGSAGERGAARMRLQEQRDVFRHRMFG